jgi:hypothetical protein
LFGFANSLDSASDMIENTMIKVHASQVIKTFDKIILSITKSSINEQDKKKLFELGKLHYHFGLKKEYFKVINLNNIKFYPKHKIIFKIFLLRFLKIVSFKV